MNFEDEIFAIIDDDGETVAFAQLEDVTGDNIPDVVHIMQDDGNEVYLSLSELEANGTLLEAFEETDSGLSFDDDSMGELGHHLEPGQIREPYSNRLYETDQILDADIEHGENGLFDIINYETDNIFDSDIKEALFETSSLIDSSDISFTGLVDKGMVNSDTYQSWLDGVEPDEVTAEDISVIADHITEEFNQICPAVVVDNNSDGFAIYPNANGVMIYDIDGTVESANAYGIDNIVGSVAHEIGHNITEKAFEGSGIELTRIQKEMCADYLEGIALGLSGVSPTAKYEFLKDHNSESHYYPSTEERIEIIQKGYDFARDPINQGLSDVLFPNLNFIRNELMDNIINVY